MEKPKTILAQIVSELPKRHFRRLVERYGSPTRRDSLSYWDQFLCMTFAQLTFRESLRDIESCLRAFGGKLYRSGLRSGITRSSLARANKKHNWQVFEQFALYLIRLAQELYAEEAFALELDGAVYAFDSTTIDLCLTLFPWARFMDHPLKRKAAIKLHTLFDLRTKIPTFMAISDGKLADVTALATLDIEPGSYYVLDRGYFDTAQFARFTDAGAYFVSRPRVNTEYYRVESLPVPKNSGVRSDQKIRLTGRFTALAYPHLLRRISFYDEDQSRKIIFITNNFVLLSEHIAELYRQRWHVELFFKWIKQNLRIKNFFGQSINAVKTQIWISVASYVLIAIVKKRLSLPQPLSEILQVFSLSLFEEMPILQAFQRNTFQQNYTDSSKQLILF